MTLVKKLYRTLKCPKCKDRLILVDYSHLPKHQAYDGWAELKCPICNFRIGRWSGKILKEGEFENIKLRDNN